MEPEGLESLINSAIDELQKLPWAQLIVSSLTIMWVDEDSVASVGQEPVIYIGNKFADVTGGDPALAAGILLHEALHLLLSHPSLIPRAKRIAESLGVSNWRELLIIAADAVVNEFVLPHFSLPPGAVTKRLVAGLLGIRPFELPQTADGIFLLLVSRQDKRASGRGRWNPINDLREEGSSREKGVQCSGNRTRILHQGWATSVADVLWKAIGLLPGKLLRLVKVVPKPRPPRWLAELKRYLVCGLRYSIVSDWRRESKRHPEFPGRRYLFLPDVWCLVDTSGSISEEELRFFLSEIVGIVRSANSVSRVFVVPWDARVHGVFELRKQGDVRRLRLYGGGGTVIREALETAVRGSKRGDIVVIMTDGYIADIDEAGPLLSKLSMKVGKIIVLTTGERIEHPSVVNIKVRRVMG